MNNFIAQENGKRLSYIICSVLNFFILWKLGLFIMSRIPFLNTMMNDSISQSVGLMIGLVVYLLVVISLSIFVAVHGTNAVWKSKTK